MKEKKSYKKNYITHNLWHNVEKKAKKEKLNSEQFMKIVFAQATE